VSEIPPSMSARFEMPTRALSGVVLGTAAIAAVAMGGVIFAALVAAGAIAALWEWHRLVGSGRFLGEWIATGLTMIGVVWLARQQGSLPAVLLAVGTGATLAAAVAALRRPPVLASLPWHALGAVYVGLPVLALLMLRDSDRGAFLVGGLFVAVWTADTGALFVGRLVGGPKLAPEVSPNKTWAGFLGGTIAASLAEALYAWLLGGSPLLGAGFGLCLALAGAVGDLFESWVKRRFHAKNTGRLIPGHGGLLDRVDSLLFAGPACALLTFLLGFGFLEAVSP
jgi:phosphatidate cytidylyltransferase